MARSHSESAAPKYAWLLDVLFGGTHMIRWAPAGELPVGFELVEQFAVLPSGLGRSFLVSLCSRRAASSALTSYNALRSPRWRLARRVIGAGLRVGLAEPLMAGKVDVGTAAAATREQLAGALLSEHLGDVFGRGPVAVAISGGDGPYRKPVLQVFSREGAPLGYVKVGWNDWTRAAVRREATALQTCAGRALRQLSAPALLDHHVWRGLDLLATAPIPAGVRRLPVRSSLPGVAVLREITALSERYVGELASSPWWGSLRTRITSGVADLATRAQIDEIADRIERSNGHARLEFGTWHGDFAPWNLALDDGCLIAWDWEDSAPSVPVGFDALHFHFQVAFVARQLPLEAAVRATGKARVALEMLGVPADSHPLVSSLHLLELLVRHEQARGSLGEAYARFGRSAIDVLDQTVAVPPGAAHLRCSRWMS